MLYEKQFEIYYKDATANGEIRLDCLLQYLQEAAILHSIYVGFDETYMQKNNCAWVMNKLILQMKSMPKIRSLLKIKTWSNELKSFKATREFEIYENGSCVGVASTKWFFIDFIQKKVKRISDEVKNFYGELQKNVGIDSENTNFEVSSFNTIFTKNHSLRHCDIDTNGHLNNTIYAQLVEDTVANVIDKFTIRSFKILYKREVSYNINNLVCDVGKIDENSFSFRFSKDDTIFSYGNIELG